LATDGLRVEVDRGLREPAGTLVNPERPLEPSVSVRPSRLFQAKLGDFLPQLNLLAAEQIRDVLDRLAMVVAPLKVANFRFAPRCPGIQVGWIFVGHFATASGEPSLR